MLHHSSIDCTGATVCRSVLKCSEKPVDARIESSPFENLASARVLCRGQVTGPPIEDDLEALQAVTRVSASAELVVLARKNDKLGGHSPAFQCRVVALRLRKTKGCT